LTTKNHPLQRARLKKAENNRLPSQIRSLKADLANQDLARTRSLEATKNRKADLTNPDLPPIQRAAPPTKYLSPVICKKLFVFIKRYYLLIIYLVELANTALTRQ
jgi:hypothetical protein